MPSCTACLLRGKTWKGSDPACAFDHAGLFQTDNWNCATMNNLRTLAETLQETDAGGYRRWGPTDASLCVIPIPDDTCYPEGVSYPDPDWPEGRDFAAGFIVLSFYKNRGRTAQAWVMWDDFPVRPLTLHDAEATLRAYHPALSSDG